jgi:hypothetical protein
VIFLLTHSLAPIFIITLFKIKSNNRSREICKRNIFKWEGKGLGIQVVKKGWISEEQGEFLIIGLGNG